MRDTEGGKEDEWEKEGREGTSCGWRTTRELGRVDRRKSPGNVGTAETDLTDVPGQTVEQCRNESTEEKTLR